MATRPGGTAPLVRGPNSRLHRRLSACGIGKVLIAADHATVSASVRRTRRDRGRTSNQPQRTTSAIRSPPVENATLTSWANLTARGFPGPLLRLFLRQQVVLRGEQRQLQSIRDAYLLENVREVVLDRLLADVER